MDLGKIINQILDYNFRKNLQLYDTYQNQLLLHCRNMNVARCLEWCT